MKNLFERSKQVLFEKEDLEFPFYEIQTLIAKQFGVKPLFVSYDEHFFRLNIIFRNQADFHRYNLESASQFGTTPKSYKIYFPILSKYLDRSIDQLYLNATHFKFLAVQNIFSTSDLTAFRSQLNIDSLWKVIFMGHSKTVFFFEGSFEEFKLPENKAKLSDAYFAFLKKNDEFDLLEREQILILIESRATFEGLYQGSMQYYSKDH